MLKENVKKIMGVIKKKDSVLDIGGWAMPFNRANYIVDIQPYETRGFFGSQGGNKEHFTKKTWILHDISSKKKLPFKNKQIDFIICSQTLEDIRDPVWFCSELIRVAKKGYIEVPSMTAELTKGIASKKYAGYYHHRWLINILDNKIIFRFKPHFLHNDWRFHLPKRYLKNLNDKKKVSYLFWKNRFDYEEVIQISRDKVEKKIYNFIKSKKFYPKIYYSLDKYLRIIKNKLAKIKRKISTKAYYHRYMDTPEFKSK